MTRKQLVAEAQQLRSQGLTHREIGRRLGRSTQWAHEACTDPDRTLARARKVKRYGFCRDCGKRVVNSGSEPGERCGGCARAHQKAMNRRFIIDSFHEWNRLFGRPPSSTDWNPAKARYNIDRRRRRLAQTERPWPPPQSVINQFGSWNNGLRAAGFTPLSKGEYWIGREGVQLRDEDARLVA